MADQRRARPGAGRGLVRPAWRVAVLGLALLVSACTGLPSDVERTPSFALSDTQDTFLAKTAGALGDPGDGRSGVRLITSGPEALALRLLLIEKAERSVDAQYYILHGDVAGTLVAGELLKAADRGVRVRLLLDDMYTDEYDPMAYALTHHPNMEIRLFNPFRREVSRTVGGLFDFGRVNRRMHNKSMTFDNQVSIVGGRNIGDPYFAAGEDSNYDDLDLLAAGPVVRGVSAIFDAYWNSPYAVPAAAAIGEPPAGMTLDAAREKLMALYREARRTEYGAAVTEDIERQVRTGRYELTWVPAKVMADSPDKAAGETDAVLASSLMPVLLGARSELAVVTAYFVPGEGGTKLLTSLAQRGVKVTILTNSLDSTDVEPVHGHYAHYRKALLDAGVELWELRPDKVRPDRKLIHLGQSRSGLHSKAFAVDGRYLFVGSFNWDPRSAGINTEMGILVDSPEVAQAAVSRLMRDLPGYAYRLRLSDEGEIEWVSRGPDGGEIVYEHEPSESAWRKFRTDLYGALPIGGLL